MKGRKAKQESRAGEFRQRLVAWIQTPVSLRPSLRALARELGTSHQLLAHYLEGLQKWEYQELYRKANEEREHIRATAKSESRDLTPWEQQRLTACNRAALQATLAPALLENVERLRQSAGRGPVHRLDLQMAKKLAQMSLPGAAEVLEKCSKVGLKKRKSFVNIVRDTPRKEGEPSVAWVRRIWNECGKYETNCPQVVTEELLEKVLKR